MINVCMPRRLWTVMFFLFLYHIAIYFGWLGFFWGMGIDPTLGSPWSSNFDPRVIMTSPYFIYAIAGIFGPSILIYLTFQLTTYRDSSRTYGEFLISLRSFAIDLWASERNGRILDLKQRIVDTMIVSSTSVVYDDLLTELSTLAGDIFGMMSDEFEYKSKITTVLFPRKIGRPKILEHVDLFGRELYFVKQVDPISNIPQVYFRIQDLRSKMGSMKTIHDSPIPSTLYIFALFGSILGTTLSVPYFLSLYGWTIGTITIAFIDLGSLLVVYIMHTVGSIFSHSNFGHAYYKLRTGIIQKNILTLMKNTSDSHGPISDDDDVVIQLEDGNMSLYDYYVNQ